MPKSNGNPVVTLLIRLPNCLWSSTIKLNVIPKVSHEFSHWSCSTQAPINCLLWHWELVGTKFLTEETLQTEEQEAMMTTMTPVVHGGCTWDLHAKLLCR